VAFERVEGPAFESIRPIVESSFAHRRKMLANSVALTGLATREEAENALAAIGRSSSVRAEELAPAEFVLLAEALA
jgi:16S rRNA A1518/A1519 N6-dimethyltransferase RsmA/KsgA/DIM1 with predicted DNA glycosylase/AP lyase activity